MDVRAALVFGEGPGRQTQGVGAIWTYNAGDDQEGSDEKDKGNEQEGDGTANRVCHLWRAEGASS